MTEVTKVKRGDVGVIFADTLTEDDEAVNLTGATVTFILRLRGGTVPVTGTATIVDATGGTVSYATVAGNLDVAGLYNQEWEVTYGNGDKFTYPSDTWNPVRIVGDLNP